MLCAPRHIIFAWKRIGGGSHACCNLSLDLLVHLVILKKIYNSTYLIINNGSLYIKDQGNTNDFCVDNSIDNLGNIEEIIIKCIEATEDKFGSHPDLSTRPRSCLDEYVHILRLFNTVSGSISCVFLAITFLNLSCSNLN